MDGSVRCFFSRGRRISLASQKTATTTFPLFTYYLALGTLRVDAPLNVRGIWLVHMTIPQGPATTVLMPDYDRIQTIAKEFAPQPRIFLSEPDSDIFSRISARLAVLFSDRSPY